MTTEDPTTATTAAAVAASAAASAAALATQKVSDSVAKVADSVLLLGNDVGYMKSDIAEIKIMLDSRYVIKEEHLSLVKDVALLQRVVFTGIGVVLLTVIGAVLSMVLIK